MPEPPVTTVPQILVPEVIKTDKVFEKIVKKVQESEKVYHKVIPVTVEVVKIDDDVSKYVTVM